MATTGRRSSPRKMKAECRRRGRDGAGRVGDILLEYFVLDDADLVSLAESEALGAARRFGTEMEYDGAGRGGPG